MTDEVEYAEGINFRYEKTVYGEWSPVVYHHGFKPNDKKEDIQQGMLGPWHKVPIDCVEPGDSINFGKLMKLYPAPSKTIMQ